MSLLQAAVRPTLLLAALVTHPLTVTSAAAQTAALSAALPPKPEFKHHRKITTVYAAERDTTTVAVVLAKGKYFLWTQRPKVTVAYQYPGAMAPTGLAASAMLIEFRTQEPQAAATNRLTITGEGAGDGEPPIRIEEVASTSRLEAHAFTNDHRMTFVMPAEDAVRILAARHVALEVGGVVVRLKEEQIQAWRELAWQMGAWGR
jgi:hypothetical protein